MTVVVTPPATIKVRVGSVTQPVVQSTSTFTGALSADQTQNIQNAYNEANNSYTLANSVYGVANTASSQANTAYSLANTALQTTGGTVTGNLAVSGGLGVTGNVYIDSIYLTSNNIIANSVVVDGGGF
jgi:hypothetical protein